MSGAARPGRLARAKRRVDRGLYRGLAGLYRRVFPARAPAGAALRPDRVRRLLVARVERVGDLVLLSPALSYLRAALPNAELEVLATPANASLLAGDPRVARVHVYPSTAAGWLRAARALRARRYDAVLSVRLRDHLDEGLFAAAVAPPGAARVTAHRPAQYAGLFTHRVRIPRAYRHVVDRFLYLARAACGDAPDGPPDRAAALARHPALLPESAAAAARAERLAAERAGGRAYVALNAWASDPRRGFGAVYAAELAAGVVARRPDLAVVLTPPPAHAAEAAEVARLANARPAEARLTAGAAAAGLPNAEADAEGRVVVAPPSADLHDLVALVRRAAAVVSPDTATVHVASALGVPVVAVYTDLAVEADAWGAWGARRRVVHLAERRPVSDVPAAEVLDALDALLGGPPRPSAD